MNYSNEYSSKVAVLSLGFNLHPSRIPHLRAAIVERVGLANSLFHGHDNSNSKSKYTNKTALIQYSIDRGQAQIIGVKDGKEAILKCLLPVYSGRLTIGGEEYHSQNWKISMFDFCPKISDFYTTFGLYKWIALNKENYLNWKFLNSNETARRVLLNKCLTEHLKIIGDLFLPKEETSKILARILRIDNVKMIRWHGTNLITFSVIAESNLNLFENLCVGKCRSFGFGQVLSESKYKALVSKK